MDDLEKAKRVWREYLTTPRVPAEIGQIVGLPARTVHQILVHNIGRPTIAEEDELSAEYRKTIPNPEHLFAGRGVRVSDIDTAEDIRLFKAEIMSEVTEVERILAEQHDIQDRTGERQQSNIWWARTKNKRRYLKAVLAALDFRNGQINKARREVEKAENIRKAEAQQKERNAYIVDVVRELDPDLLRRAIKIAIERWPEAMNSKG